MYVPIVPSKGLGFFRIAVRERHIRELSTHLASNNALVFDTLGTDVDILRQFTPEHLMKYLEYNSGSEPIPIEQIQVPFTLNRDSLSLSVQLLMVFNNSLQRIRKQLSISRLMGLPNIECSFSGLYLLVFIRNVVRTWEDVTFDSLFHW